MLTVIEHLTGLSLVTPELTAPSLSLQILIILLVGFVISKIQQIFKDWDGVKTIRQYEQTQHQEKIYFIIEGSRELVRKIKRKEPLPLYNSDT